MLNTKYQYNLFPDCSTTMVRASVDVRNQWKASDSYTDYLHSYMDCKRYLHSSTSLAFVDGLQRTCVFEYGSLAFVYGLERRVHSSTDHWYSCTDYNWRSYCGNRTRLLRTLY